MAGATGPRPTPALPLVCCDGPGERQNSPGLLLLPRKPTLGTFSAWVLSPHPVRGTLTSPVFQMRRPRPLVTALGDTAMMRSYQSASNQRSRTSG